MQNLIGNADRITRVFGAWPSFHDAEVVRVVLDRAGPEAPTLEAQIYLYQVVLAADASGRRALKNQSLVTVKFMGVVLDELTEFNGQNVLWDLELSPLDPDQHDGCALSVGMPSSYGMEAFFKCKRCEVTSVQPYESA